MALPRNIKTLTGIRGFAALWVVFFHLQAASYFHVTPLFKDFIQHGFWGVDVFFVLSGFVLAHVYESGFVQKVSLNNYLRYLGLRLGRIYPLHAVTTAAAFAAYLFSIRLGRGTAAGSHFGLYEGAMSMALLHAWGTTRYLSWNDVSWSISAEWFAYLFMLVPCIRLLRNISLRQLYFLAAVPWCLLIFVYMPQRTSHLLDMTYDFGILRIAPEFLGGYVAYRTASAIRQSPIASDVESIAGLAAIVFVAYRDSFQILLLPACMLFLIGLSVEGPVVSWIFGNRVSVLAGELSYSIYMCHALVLFVFDGLLKRLHPAQAAMFTGAGTVLISILTVFLSSYGLYMLIERPCRNWARKELDRLLFPSMADAH